jgi:hypothetical protein
MPCTQCMEDPFTHSFEKVGEIQRSTRLHIYYTSYKSIKDYTNSAAISSHIIETLNGISGESWIWVMDCKFMQTKHLMQLGVSLKLLKLLRERYGLSLHALYLLNSGTIVQSAMVTLGPFMNKGFKDSIHRLTGTPLELHELLIKRYGFTGSEIEPIMRRIVREYA